MQRSSKALFFTFRLVVFATALAFAGPAYAQTAPATIRLQPEDAARGRNGHQLNFYFLPPGVEGERYVSAGFFGQKLRPYLANNAEALGKLADYRRQKTLFLLDRLVAVGALGVYGVQVLAKDGEQQYFSANQQVTAGVFVASLLATIAINRHTNEHLQQAVAAYNSGLPGAHGSWWRRLPPTTVGLRPAAQGQLLLALGWAVR